MSNTRCAARGQIGSMNAVAMPVCSSPPSVRRSRGTIEVRSALRASPDEVWKHASTMNGVNYELGPWIRMTVPRAAEGKGLADVQLGREAFVSVVLLLSVLPFDVHHLTLERVLERGFDEESWSWLQRRWRHERRIEPSEGGCVVADRVTVEPRFAPVVLVAPIVQRIFERRHRRLRARFGKS
jgi:ligand-binding SRPBCC domain-containing protein